MTSLLNNVEYTFAVRAVNEAGIGPPSAKSEPIHTMRTIAPLPWLCCVLTHTDTTCTNSTTTQESFSRQ